MTKYDLLRKEMAKKAKDEYLEFVVTKPGSKLSSTMRAIDYMVKRMAFNTVITEQMPNWLLGHMMAFTRSEVMRERKGKR